MIRMYNSVFDTVSAKTADHLGTFARLVFAGVLLVYYLKAGMTKLGEGFFGFLNPSSGAFTQIFPAAAEAVFYDTSQLTVFQWLVLVSGTWAEFLLPVAIVLGLATRLTSFGMIGFIFVQSIVDIVGHNRSAQDIGMWFDGNASALILDQRSLWVFVLVVLVVKGAGPLSLDRKLGLR